MQTQVTPFMVIEAKKQVDAQASQFNYNVKRHSQALERRQHFYNQNPEVNQPTFVPIIYFSVLIVLVLFIIFQANTDGAAVAEAMFGSAAKQYHLLTYSVGLAFCLFGFLTAKCLNPRHGYDTNLIGRRRLNISWWGGLVGTLFYLGVHFYISFMLLDTGGDNAVWSAWFPIAIALMDVILGFIYGHSLILMIQLFFKNLTIKRLYRQVLKAARKTSEAFEHYKFLLQMYNTSFPNQKIELVETENIRRANDFHLTSPVEYSKGKSSSVNNIQSVFINEDPINNGVKVN